ncbi:MAG TPA: class I SAM-dependent methyltransferase [Geobacteraceae bacterium]
MQSCNVCGNRLTECFPEVRDPLTGEIFAIERCAECGLGHTVPQPSNLGRYYASRYYGNRHGFTARFCSTRRMRFVAASAGRGEGKSLLDIGCGDGAFLLEARQSGWNVTGTELNPAMAREAGLDVREDIALIGGEGKFHCITMWHTLEHMRDIPSMLGHAARLLSPEGRLIVAVPDWGGLQARIFGPRWLHLDVPRHLYHFDAGALRRSLETAGFAPEREWHQEFEYDLLGFSQSALNYLMPHPNVFFDALTGKGGGHGRIATTAGLVQGSLLTVLSLPLLAAGTLSGRGGTLIAVVKKTVK